MIHSKKTKTLAFSQGFLFLPRTNNHFNVNIY